MEGGKGEGRKKEGWKERGCPVVIFFFFKKGCSGGERPEKVSFPCELKRGGEGGRESAARRLCLRERRSVG